MEKSYQSTLHSVLVDKQARLEHLQSILPASHQSHHNTADQALVNGNGVGEDGEHGLANFLRKEKFD